MNFFLRRSLAIAVLAGACRAAFGTPVMDLRADVLLPMASELTKSLNLTLNQQTLWQQVESRSKAILRERQVRRERLQLALKTGLDAPQVELRELNGPLEAEAGASAQEDKTLRELWLGMNDALDENQRRLAASLLAEQLMRVPESEPRPPQRGAEDGRSQHRGMGRGK